MTSEMLSPAVFSTRFPIMKFDDMAEAQDFIARSNERDPLHLGDPLRLVLGDIDEDGESPQFLVAVADDAARLVEAGYEYGDSNFQMEDGISLSL
jgi:hypothetical protein